MATENKGEPWSVYAFVNHLAGATSYLQQEREFWSQFRLKLQQKLREGHDYKAVLLQAEQDYIGGPQLKPVRALEKALTELLGMLGDMEASFEALEIGIPVDTTDPDVPL